MRYFELLRQVKEKHGALSSREEELIYDAISIYNDSFNDKEEQFKMELASGILVRNSEKLLDGTGRKELAIMGSISLAEAFVRMWKDNLKEAAKDKYAPAPIKKKGHIPEMAVGEIRELNGKKYKCVKSTLDCDNAGCVFYAGIDSECHFPLGDCADDYRSV